MDDAQAARCDRYHAEEPRQGEGQQHLEKARLVGADPTPRADNNGSIKLASWLARTDTVRRQARSCRMSLIFPEPDDGTLDPVLWFAIPEMQEPVDDAIASRRRLGRSGRHATSAL